MGQMTYGILFGVKKAAPKSFGEDGWYDLRRRYSANRDECPDEPCGDGSRNHIGFWVAVGGSGRDGTPYLTATALDAVPTTRSYKAAYKRAVKAWGKFAKWCEQNKIAIGEPKLYLVETEVA